MCACVRTYVRVSASPPPDHPANTAARLLAGARQLLNALRLPERQGGAAGVCRRRPGETHRLHRRGAGVITDTHNTHTATQREKQLANFASRSQRDEN